MSKDEYKFLKPVDGSKGPKEGADVAILDKSVSGKDIVAFWLAELTKAAEAEEKKKQESK